MYGYSIYILRVTKLTKLSSEPELVADLKNNENIVSEAVEKSIASHFSGIFIVCFSIIL